MDPTPHGVAKFRANTLRLLGFGGFAKASLLTEPHGERRELCILQGRGAAKWD
ncbi:hypothetical protein ABIA03_000484 [Bradyrhizobium yuanmingense]|uniref:Uncharacterized protein n=1 Tax=Bradyrhizobium yuanmingense TaxID=108015 RepID=A0ABV4GNZ9_9BRAD